MNRTNGRNVPDPALSPSRALFRRLAAQDGEFEPPELFQQLFRRFRGEAADPFFERFFTGFRFSADEADRDRAVTPELFSLLAEAAAGRRADGSFYTPPGIAAVPPLAIGKKTSITRCPVSSGSETASFRALGRGERTGQ